MPYYDGDSKTSDENPAIIDTATSPMEDLTNAEQAFVDANDKLTKEIIPCAIELIKAWDVFETKSRELIAVLDAERTAPAGFTAQPTFSFSGQIDGKEIMCKNCRTWDKLQYMKMPWPKFKAFYEQHWALMTEKMAAIPDINTLTKYQAPGAVGEDELEAAYKTIIKANHGSADKILMMGQSAVGEGYYGAEIKGTPAAELVVSPLDKVPDNWYHSGTGRKYRPSAWHPQQWFEPWLSSGIGKSRPEWPTEKTFGISIGGFMKRISSMAAHATKYPDDFWYNKFYNYKPDGSSKESHAWKDAKPEWIVQWHSKWNVINKVLWDSDNALRPGGDTAKGTVDYQYGKNQTWSDSSARNDFSPGTSASTVRHTFLGNTYFMGTLREPETMAWWNTNWDFTDKKKSRDWVRYASFIGYNWVSTTRGSFNQWVFKEGTGRHGYGDSYFVTTNYPDVGDIWTKYFTDHPTWDSGPATAVRIRQAMGVCNKHSIDGLDPGANSANNEFRGSPYSTGNGYIGEKNVEALEDAYYAAKTAMMDLREKVKCILNLDVDVYIKATDMKEIAEYYEDNPSVTSEVRDKAKEQLEKLNSLKGKILQATSTYTKNIIFREQCFLLANVLDLAAWNAQKQYNESSLKAIPYKGDTAKANASIMIDADPYGYLNRLTNNKHDHYLFNAENWDISTLQPKISLYKIEFDEARKKETETKIEFSSFANNEELRFDPGSGKQITDMLTNKRRRGFGVGIQNFTFSYEGSNPFSAKKSIKAKLVIFANSFDELMVDRVSWETGGLYKYVDLALKTSNNRKAGDKCKNYGLKSQNKELAKLNFRLKAVVGWAFPAGNKDHMTPGLKSALYDSFVTLNLVPTVHNFDFDEQGRVTFEINYLAFVDDYFDQTLYNIFTDSTISKQQIMRKLTYKNYKRQCKHEAIKALKKAAQADIAEEKRTSISQLIGSLMDTDNIYYIDMPYDDIRNFMSQGPFYELGGDKMTPKTSAQRSTQAELDVEAALTPYIERNEGEALNQQAIRAALTVNNPNKADVPFFFVSDLVDVILADMTAYFEDMSKWAKSIPSDWETREGAEAMIGGITYKNAAPYSCDMQNKSNEIIRTAAEFKKFRLVLGPLEIVSRTDDIRTRTFNMGDMPISVKYFIEFLTDKLAKKEETVYTLANFLRDLFNSLIRNFLNDDTCFSTNVKQKVTVNQSVISSYKNPHSRYDEIVELARIGRTSISRLERLARKSKKNSILNISGISGQHDGGNLGFENQINYLSFFAGRIRPMEKMTGDRASDEAAGIMHYVLGKDKGIVKNIALSKTQTPGLQEVRFEQDGYDGLQQLRVVYDVEIDAYAFPKTFPGTYIFVNPQSFAPTTNLIPCDPLNLTQYGIGGYYMIIRSAHEFGAGEANTKITAKWVNEVDSSGPTKESCGDGGIEDPKKCS